MTHNRSVFISGCHMCPALMAKPPTNGDYLAPPLIQWAKENDIRLVRMRCPETEFAGVDRKPRGRAYYNKAPGFRELCKTIARFEADRIWRMGDVIAVIGVATSPACGTNFGGKNNPYMPSGIYMEELNNECDKLCVWPTFTSVWPKHPHKMVENLADVLKRARLTPNYPLTPPRL